MRESVGGSLIAVVLAVGCPKKFGIGLWGGVDDPVFLALCASGARIGEGMLRWTENEPVFFVGRWR